ncbi:MULTISPECIES: TusE/DsrC/DsvC family sulfur relay protein [unclassified Francisella]|uniref:TusE/DsrC/DsvC family sulfur relay protein n=1 Tax=unclassified Francisella TaxID=2610885 RepID=UPI002E36F6A6|nr:MULTISPECIES: TusE/DsrC/DsvC family sulfur relay protein [unclassified Francisella]MED7818554.1 TusE/DsrC/DsvC family sulfur relay protein [Francisella sp. 19S2-4]MED7829390.1 TusE/DsrC/DsvC family sulfur relay protein [Francisella sp. 19S2-10]
MDNYNIDEHGFLVDFESWDMDFCKLAAISEDINLSEDHILIINFLRDFYKKNKKSPAIRELVKALKENYGEKIGNSLYLQILFPISPAVQAAKLAGLPKPKRCI